MGKQNPANPQVSIIIPTYNSGETLAKCLESVYRQSYSSYDVIVVDNSSSDVTMSTAKGFGARIIQRKCNPALARNIGVANANGKYLFFVDSDQVLSPSVTEECVRKCEDEGVGMVRIPELFIGRSFWSSCSAIWKNHYERLERLHVNTGGGLRGEPRFFIKREVTDVGMLDTGLLWGENFDLYERLKKMGVKEASCRSKLYHFEPLSVREVMIKNLRYGKSMPIFLQQTKKPIFPWMLRHALSTFGEILRSQNSPAVIVGCAVLSCLRTYFMVMGMLTGLLFPTIYPKRSARH